MIKGIIFDMDGVIADTEKTHCEVDQIILKPYGIDIDADTLERRFAGMKMDEIITQIFKEHNVDSPVEPVVKQKWDTMTELAKKSVAPIPGVVELINNFHKNNFPMAVASSSIRGYINVVLNTIGVYPKFKSVVSGDDVVDGKPDPSIFLLASKNIGIKPEECLVFEDGISGMIAAKRAGMRCVAISNDPNRELPADKVVNSFLNLDIEEILRF